MTPSSRPATPPAWRWLMRITGLFALLLFLTPTFYVVKYYAHDRPEEERRAALVSTARIKPGISVSEDAVQSKHALLKPNTPDNIALQEKVAEHDADPLWRREAVRALGATLTAPGMGWRRPMDALTGKATLAQLATGDTDPSVRAAASETLGEIARHGAVIRR